jgi:hypothetical protein
VWSQSWQRLCWFLSSLVWLLLTSEYSPHLERISNTCWLPC